MRLVEFASAEEQIALWKLVSDSVWSSLQQQQQQQREVQATAVAGRAKREPPLASRKRKRVGKKRKSKPPRASIPAPKPAPRPAPTVRSQQAAAQQGMTAPNVQQQPVQQSQPLQRPSVQSSHHTNHSVAHSNFGKAISTPSPPPLPNPPAATHATLNAGQRVVAAHNSQQQRAPTAQRATFSTVKQREDAGEEPVKRR
jgi:hypothetical protein